MPRRTRGAGGAFFSRTKKQHRKSVFLFGTFSLTRQRKSTLNIKKFKKKFENRLFQHALAKKIKFK
jgi:hypothetical protein